MYVIRLGRGESTHICTDSTYSDGDSANRSRALYTFENPDPNMSAEFPDNTWTVLLLYAPGPRSNRIRGYGGIKYALPLTTHNNVTVPGLNVVHMHLCAFKVEWHLYYQHRSLSPRLANQNTAICAKNGWTHFLTCLSYIGTNRLMLRSCWKNSFLQLLGCLHLWKLHLTVGFCWSRIISIIPQSSWWHPLSGASNMKSLKR